MHHQSVVCYFFNVLTKITIREKKTEIKKLQSSAVLKALPQFISFLETYGNILCCLKMTQDIWASFIRKIPRKLFLVILGTWNPDIKYQYEKYSVNSSAVGPIV